jgi:signal transduction histidine kinase
VRPETHEALERVVREAVSNAIRHGRAQTVTVQLSEAPELRLLVSDDGRGFTAPDPGPGHHGLVNMRERVDAIGGRLQIRSRAGEGTEVLVVVP